MLMRRECDWFKVTQMASVPKGGLEPGSPCPSDTLFFSSYYNWTLLLWRSNHLGKLQSDMVHLRDRFSTSVKTGNLSLQKDNFSAWFLKMVSTEISLVLPLRASLSPLEPSILYFIVLISVVERHHLRRNYLIDDPAHHSRWVEKTYTTWSQISISNFYVNTPPARKTYKRR